tara:strand:- start:1776 stop:2102 length:327 start_codon:yes stop_codon:yes gene_type:complete
MLSGKLTDKQLEAITQGVATILLPEIKKLAPTSEPVEIEQDEDEEKIAPEIRQLCKTRDQLVMQMAKPVVKIYTGRYGSTRVNQTLESLEEVNKMIKDHRTGKSSKRM